MSGTALTATEIRSIARQFGADEVEIHETPGTVEVRVDQKNPTMRERLCKELRKRSPPSVQILVTLMDGDDDEEFHHGMSGDMILTDYELVRVMQALPDDFGPPEDIDITDVERIDWDSISDLVDAYGGKGELLQAVMRSTATERDESAAETGVSASRTGDDETPSEENESASAPAQERTAVEQAKDAYVAGEIGVLELEDRLEDAIDLGEPLSQKI